MIQDILPKKYDNTYSDKAIEQESVCLVFNENMVLVGHRACDNDGEYRHILYDDGTPDNSANDMEMYFPRFKDIAEHVKEYTYLFNVDGEDYFLVKLNTDEAVSGFDYENYKEHRHVNPKYRVFAEMTGYHLYVWYRDNRFCGRCGQLLKKHDKLRAMQCPECGSMIFPRISPAVIVGVSNGDKLLMTKYNGRFYKGYALIAGFVEIGESAEETIKREVFEEVGIRVKNIRYYTSQPWGMDGSFLLGYFAELEGEDNINMDTEELSLARWYTRDEITVFDDDISMTSKMIAAWKAREV